MFQLDLNETFPHLPRAPIVEAVIHWQARALNPWDRQQIRRELARRFPDYPNPRLRPETQVGQDRSATEIRRDRWSGLRLRSTDELQEVQFNRDGLVFSRLQPYEDWRQFSQEACRFWDAFVELAGCSEVQRLGVRFINRVEIAEPELIHNSLRAAPACLEPLGLPTDEFFCHNLHAVPGLPLKIAVIRTIHPYNSAVRSRA